MEEELTEEEKEWLNMLLEKAYEAPFDKTAVQHCMFSLYKKFKKDIKMAREEAYHQGCHEMDLKITENFNRGLKEENSELVEIIKEAGRLEALKEVRTILEKEKQKWHEEYKEYKRINKQFPKEFLDLDLNIQVPWAKFCALSDAISLLPILKEKK